jgi:hypothetical protein
VNRFTNVFRFGAPYLRRYWTRLLMGVLLGILFGISNAGILAFSKALLNRVFPEKETVLRAAEEKSFFRAKTDELKQALSRAVDPWLPAKDRN